MDVPYILEYRHTYTFARGLLSGTQLVGRIARPSRIGAKVGLRPTSTQLAQMLHSVRLQCQ